MSDTQHYKNNEWVYLVDPDPGHYALIKDVAAQLGLGCQCFDSLDEVYSQDSLSRPACLCVTPTQLQAANVDQLAGHHLATVVLAHQPSVADVVHWMRVGAVAVLPTPLQAPALQHWLEEALESDRLRHHQASQLQHLTACYERLSDRKRAVLRHMIEGQASKWSAHQLDVSRRTIELDRADILLTFEARNVLELAGRVGPWLDRLQQCSSPRPPSPPSQPVPSQPVPSQPTTSEPTTSPPHSPHPRSLSAAASDHRQRWTLLST